MYSSIEIIPTKIRLGHGGAIPRKVYSKMIRENFFKGFGQPNRMRTTSREFEPFESIKFIGNECDRERKIPIESVHDGWKEQGMKVAVIKSEELNDALSSAPGANSVSISTAGKIPGGHLKPYIDSMTSESTEWYLNTPVCRMGDRDLGEAELEHAFRECAQMTIHAHTFQKSAQHIRVPGEREIKPFTWPNFAL